MTQKGVSQPGQAVAQATIGVCVSHASPYLPQPRHQYQHSSAQSGGSSPTACTRRMPLHTEATRAAACTSARAARRASVRPAHSASAQCRRTRAAARHALRRPVSVVQGHEYTARCKPAAATHTHEDKRSCGVKNTHTHTQGVVAVVAVVCCYPMPLCPPRQVIHLRLPDRGLEARVCGYQLLQLESTTKARRHKG